MIEKYDLAAIQEIVDGNNDQAALSRLAAAVLDINERLGRIEMARSNCSCPLGTVCQQWDCPRKRHRAVAY